MSRLPALSSSKLLKILQSIGFDREHQRGSHIFLHHPDGRTTTVPLHKGEDIGRGLLRKILKDIRLERDDFISLL